MTCEREHNYNPYGYGYGSQAQPPSLWQACSQVCPSVWKPACCHYFPSLASGSQNLLGRKKRSAWTSSCLTSSRRMTSIIVGSTNGLCDPGMMIHGDAEVSIQTQPQFRGMNFALSHADCKSQPIPKKMPPGIGLDSHCSLGRKRNLWNHEALQKVHCFYPHCSE